MGNMQLIKAQQSGICAKKKRKYLHESRFLVRCEHQRASRRDYCVQFIKKQALVFQVTEYGDGGVVPRSLKMQVSIFRAREMGM